MKRIIRIQLQVAMLMTVACLALSPLAVHVGAQTPGADPGTELPVDPPPVTNPPVTEPPVTEPPVTEPPVTQPPATEPPATEPPVTEPPVTEPPATEPPDEDEASKTETPTSEATEEPDAKDDVTPEVEADDDSESATPTPTEEVIVPDVLQVVGDVNVTIQPGDYKDVVVRYTLGSDREKTEMSATLTAPNGESLDDWSLAPWQRVDLDDDPQDANRHLKARIDFTDSLDNGDVYQTTWRVTAPDHIEEPVTVRLHLSSKIHREDGVTEGVVKKDLINFSAIASEHNPTLTCDEVIAEDVDNTWNCAFDTTHPDGDVVTTASADVPDGWDLALDDALLSNEPMALSAEAIATEGFTLTAEYPIGCPDIGATFSASVSLSMTYPSGEVSVLNAELPLVFERPNPTFEVTSFEFGEINDMDSLVTDGALTLSYANAPCAWQASIQLSDLASEEHTVDSVQFSVTEVEFDGEVSVAMTDSVLVITAPAASDEAAAGTLTIHLKLELPHLIPPGLYVVKIVTQFVSLDEI